MLSGGNVRNSDSSVAGELWYNAAQLFSRDDLWWNVYESTFPTIVFFFSYESLSLFWAFCETFFFYYFPTNDCQLKYISPAVIKYSVMVKIKLHVCIRSSNNLFCFWTRRIGAVQRIIVYNQNTTSCKVSSSVSLLSCDLYIQVIWTYNIILHIPG